MTGRDGPEGTARVVGAVGAWPRDAAVVRRAAEEAAHRGCPVTLLHVDDARGTGRTGAPSPLPSAGALAGGLVPDLEVRTRIHAGPVVEGILRATRAADLVVLGSEGAPPLAKVVRGAVTVNVAALAHGLVEVVPVPGPGEGGRPDRTRVVLLLAERDQLGPLADVAFAEARRSGATLHLWDLLVDPADPVEEGHRAAARHVLEAALAPWRNAYPDVRPDVAVGVSAAGALGALGPGDVAVAGRGHGTAAWGRPDGATRLLLERARCPVLVVPPSAQRRDRERVAPLRA